MAFEKAWIKSETITESDEEYTEEDKPEYVAVGKINDLSDADASCTSKEFQKPANAIKTKQSSKIKTRGPKKSFVCETCVKVFRTRKELLIHIRVHTNERPFKCELCEKAFKQRNALKDHLVLHTGERKYVCKICNGRFSTSSSLNRHVYRIHDNQNPFQCSLCPEIFENKSDYTKHRATHFSVLNLTSEEVYENFSATGIFICPLCDKQIRKKQLIFVHLDVHSEPISCSLCEEKFTYLALRGHHSKFHQWTACTVCGEAFSNKWAKLKHEKQHFMLPSDTCDYCVQIFETGELLQEHMRDVHSNTIPCPLCFKMFAVNHLDYHLSFSHFKCRDCKLYFRSKEDRVVHYKYKHLPHKEYKFRCKKCTAKFLSKSRLAFHMNAVHLIVSSFICVYCGKDLKRYRMLDKHLVDNHKSMLRGSKVNRNCLLNVNNRTTKTPAKKDETIVCEICWEKGELETFKHKIHLHRHFLNNHTEIAPQLLPDSCRCEHCNELFLNSYSLKIHLQEVHHEYNSDIPLDFSLTCKDCSISFLSPYMLKEHFINVHKDENKSSCLYCPYQATSRKVLLDHMCRRHRTAMPNHIIRKYDALRVRCPTCSQVFKNPTALKRHLPVHLLPELRCPHCKMEFRSRGGMGNHIKTCTRFDLNDKNCPHCPFQAACKRDILRHMNGKHRTILPESLLRKLDAQMLSCPTCDHKCDNAASFRRHLQQHLLPEQYCPNCRKSFKSRGTMSKHLRTCAKYVMRGYECIYCGKLFDEKPGLLSHLQNEHHKTGKVKTEETTESNHVQQLESEVVVEIKGKNKSEGDEDVKIKESPLSCNEIKGEF